MITVTGAAGLTGRHVVRALLSAGLPVRALIHRPEAAEGLPDEVTDVVIADMLVPAEVERALSGASAVVHIGPAMHPREIAMGETVIDAARAVRVDHFLLMSVTHPQLEPMLNHQSKLAAERHLLLSRLPFTVMQPMHYMQNLDVAGAISAGVFQQPYSLDVPLSFVDLVDVGEAAAVVLSDPESHRLATYELCGHDTLTGREIAATVARLSGQGVAAQQVPAEAVLDRMPDAPDYTRDGFRRMFAHYDSYGLTGNANVMRWLLARDPTSFDAYVTRQLNSPDGAAS